MNKIRVILPAALAAGIAVALFMSFGPIPFPFVGAQAQDAPAAKEESATPAPAQRGGGGGGGSTTPVQVGKVTRVPMEQSIPLVGRLVAVRSGVVAARVDAPVAEMRVDIGDQVRKGDVLAVLVTDRFKWDREQKAAELAAAVAAVETAEAHLALAEQELRRYQELRDSSAFPKARYEDKRLEVNRLRTEIIEAKANAEKARATLRQAETELSNTRILAPYDGTITRRQTEVGAFIKEGEAVFAMVSDQDLEIEVDVPAIRVGALKPGMVCTFELGGGKTYEAVLRAVVPEEDLRTRTRTARFVPRFAERPDRVAANQSATLRIPVGGGREVLSVHKDALVAARGQSTVYVVEDGRAYLRQVLLGEAVGGRFEVVSGLKEGDLVVVRGNERLRDGGRVSHNGVVTQ